MLTDAVELRREDLQHDQSEAELGQAGADVGTLERPLRGADLDEFFGREDDGVGAMETQAVLVRGMASLENHCQHDGGRMEIINISVAGLYSQDGWFTRVVCGKQDKDAVPQTSCSIAIMTISLSHADTLGTKVLGARAHCR